MLTQVFHPPAIERPPFLPGAWRRGLSVRPLIFSGPFFVLTMIVICDGVGVHTKALHSGCRESNCTRRRWWSGGSDPCTHTPYHRPLYFTSLFKNHVVRYTIYQSSFFWLFFGRVEEFSGVWRETSALHLCQVAFRPLCHVPRFLLCRLSFYFLPSHRIVPCVFFFSRDTSLYGRWQGFHRSGVFSSVVKME